MFGKALNSLSFFWRTSLERTKSISRDFANFWIIQTASNGSVWMSSPSMNIGSFALSCFLLCLILQLAAVSYRSSWALEFPFELLHLFLGKIVGCTILLGQHACAYVGWMWSYAPTPTIPDCWTGLPNNATPPGGSGNDPALKEDLSLLNLAVDPFFASGLTGERSNSENQVTFFFIRFRHPSKLLSDSSEKKHRYSKLTW